MASPAPAATKSVPLTCSGHTRPVVHLEFSDLQDDGTYTLLSSCKDGNPMLRDWLGDWIGTFLGHKGAVWSSKLSGGEANRAVTGSADFSAKVWDTFSGQCLQTFPHNHIVRSVAINAAGTKILTAGHEKKIRLFDLAKPEAEPSYLVNAASDAEASKGLAHPNNIKSIVWQRGQGENTTISAGEDKTVRWWDLRTMTKSSEISFTDPITSMERSQGCLGELLTITSGKNVYFIDATTREVRKQHQLSLAPSSASVHPVNADKFIAGFTGDGWIRIYDFETAKELELHKGHHGPAHAVSYSPDGELAASGSEDGTIRLWQSYPGKKYGLWQ
ncbi:WD40 repeat-like protein [Ceraceosorus guamensis]|uniref:Serine-threonine kinase receptor-associated protein n=1 Tax=Ceraceosorus guamensis TaxID=1522189 RepID=A0A316W8E4_9BASI|nr:WD40 repeat-like protein [Ceraceosorus guamensis]PWN46102.1 WD40 repeat-like protein [Ceraceosorus guamensis]